MLGTETQGGIRDGRRGCKEEAREGMSDRKPDLPWDGCKRRGLCGDCWRRTTAASAFWRLCRREWRGILRHRHHWVGLSHQKKEHRRQTERDAGLRRLSAVNRLRNGKEEIQEDNVQDILRRKEPSLSREHGNVYLIHGSNLM